MKFREVLWGALLGALTGLPLMAASYVAQQAANQPFLPFLEFGWLARTLPGAAVTAGIEAMVAAIVALGLGPIDVVAKTVEQLAGILLVVVETALLGALVAWVLQKRDWPGRTVGAVFGIVCAIGVLAMALSMEGSGGNLPWTLLWLALLVIGWGILLGALQGALLGTLPGGPARAEEVAGARRPGRRAFLVRVGSSSVALALVAWGLGRLLSVRTPDSGAGQSLATLDGPAPGGTATPEAGPVLLPQAGATPAAPERRVQPAPGTRAEVTPNDQFYRIDIDSPPPQIVGADWQLQVTGLFDRPQSLTLRDLVAMPAVTQPITLSCISNPIGGDLISTGYWTGVRLKDLLGKLGLQPAAKALFIRSVDGFYESVVMEDMMDPRVLLVYGMNGETLPVEHGFPLRIYIPNRYGMKQPKWISSLEAIADNRQGYWVVRGWDAQAHPKIISIIDTVARDHVQDGRMPVGGIAWAGDRGIVKAEVQVDGGQWEEASLLTPPLGPLTWVLWRYDWPVAPGSHTFRVRATDGTGALQVGEASEPYPSGATGYHTVTVSFS